MDKNKNIERLFQRFLDDECTPAEVRELLQYFDADNNEALLRNLIKKQSGTQGSTQLSSEKLRYLADNTYRNIQRAIIGDRAKVLPRVIPVYHRSWFRITAAAVLVFFISTATIYFLQQNTDRVTVQNVSTIVQDVPPGTNNAVLTLGNGKTIVLDSIANGILPHQEGTKVLKMDGQIAYDQTGDTNLQSAPVYNTITTARGNQYQVMLSDGSKVWLNAASSIRFPTNFTGNERKVEITGEVYFEVAKNANKTFKVEFNNQSGGKGEIEVLGTHFNVNAYQDEADVKTTLLEGAVKVKRDSEVQMLSPGEQARINSEAITIKKDIVLSQVVAWKDGFFVFSNSDIKMIMRQVVRWYNVEVVFEGKIPVEGFTGNVPRAVPLSKFLKVLELNDIKVKVEGRKITISH